MRVLVQKLNVKSQSTKAIEWAKLITITGGGQLVVQLAGLISGVIIIRLLSVEEYALYTLANTIMGTMTTLADSGISSGTMAEGGKVWQDKHKLGIVLATGFKLRRRFGIASLALMTPVLAYLLIQHGANPLATLFIIISIIPSFYAALSDSLLEVAPKLHQEIKQLQKNQASVSLGRLFLSSVLLFIFPFTAVALIANSIPRIYGNYQLRKVAKPFICETKKIDLAVEKQMQIGVKRTLPLVIYLSIAGQLSIWIVSFFGSTANISEIGALGRIAIVFSFVSSIFSTLIVPRFSRMAISRTSLLKIFLLIQCCTLGISACVLFMILVFSSTILSIFGKSYSHLNFELFLMGVSSAIGLMATVCSQLVISRGWFLKPQYLIAANLISTLIAFSLFRVSSLIGVLLLNITISSLHFLIVFIYGLIKIDSTSPKVYVTAQV